MPMRMSNREKKRKREVGTKEEERRKLQGCSFGFFFDRKFSRRSQAQAQDSRKSSPNGRRMEGKGGPSELYLRGCEIELEAEKPAIHAINSTRVRQRENIQPRYYQ